MPGLQWLGALPQERSYVAEAMGKGMSGLSRGMARGEERKETRAKGARETRRMDIAEKD